MERISLRPHHIRFLKDHIWDMKHIEDSQECKTAIKRNREALERVYGTKGLMRMDLLAERLFGNPSMVVDVIIGLDELCSGCCFKKDCGSKNYAPVLRKYLESGQDMCASNTPEVSDEFELKRLRLDPGKDYTVAELFGDLN